MRRGVWEKERKEWTEREGVVKERRDGQREEERGGERGEGGPGWVFVWCWLCGWVVLTMLVGCEKVMERWRENLREKEREVGRVREGGGVRDRGKEGGR